MVGRTTVDAQQWVYTLVNANPNPLNHWKARQIQFLKLIALARRMNAIPASAAQVADWSLTLSKSMSDESNETKQMKRYFSSVGNTITPKRSQLSPSRVEQMEIVHSAVLAGMVEFVKVLNEKE